MKKIIAFATLALGVILGTAGTANAYPPETPPTVSVPASVAPGASFTATVTNAPAGTVSFSFEGTTVDVPVVVGGASVMVLQAPGTGSASATLTAPSAAGTYPLTATLSDGSTLSAVVTVAAGGSGGGSDSNGGSGAGSSGGKVTATAGGKGGRLPNTGGVVLPLVGLGLATLAGGFGLVYVSKRRRAIA